ncbi:uncharacterized protein LOC127900459 [Citrus sinensis]|uniref:uncharacterized protein LOC112101194 n=1 Tax=Citrus clementina TaxID=85681 RepID=UPI000CED5E56|nr:uncharacterized protein LOC112101194 [Citrus x clementina]XP_052291571.1 uncharacterized protein LOC127900459 [Citrus sinensis]
MANLSLVSILLVFFLFTAGTTMHVEAKDDESIREHCTEIDNCIEECYTFCRPGIDSISSNCTVLGSLTEPGICCCKFKREDDYSSATQAPDHKPLPKFHRL